MVVNNSSICKLGPSKLNVDGCVGVGMEFSFKKKTCVIPLHPIGLKMLLSYLLAKEQLPRKRGDFIDLVIFYSLFLLTFD